MERKGTVFRKYGKREQTSSEKPFKVLFKLIEDGEFNFIYEGSSQWAYGKVGIMALLIFTGVV